MYIPIKKFGKSQREGAVLWKFSVRLVLNYGRFSDLGPKFFGATHGTEKIKNLKNLKNVPRHILGSGIFPRASRDRKNQIRTKSCADEILCRGWRNRSPGPNLTPENPIKPFLSRTRPLGKIDRRIDCNHKIFGLDTTPQKSAQFFQKNTFYKFELRTTRPPKKFIWGSATKN